MAPTLPSGSVPSRPYPTSTRTRSIAGRPEQEQAVVLGILADAPQLEQFDCRFFHRQAVEGVDDDRLHRHFRPVGAFEIADDRVEPRDRFGMQRARHVRDPGAIARSRVGNAVQGLRADRGAISSGTMRATSHRIDEVPSRSTAKSRWNRSPGSASEILFLLAVRLPLAQN